MVVFAVSFTTPGWAGPLYSSNGIGEIFYDELGGARGMGGAGIANPNGRNLMWGNPALLTSFGIHTYSFGASHLREKASTGRTDDTDFARTRAELFKLVIPLGKGIVLGWGLTPFSRTDSMLRYPGDGYEDRVRFTGGITVSSAGIAGSFGDFIRFGTALNYNFGMIEERWERLFAADDYHDSVDYVKRKYRGYGVTVGLISKVYGNTNIGIGYTGSTDLDVRVVVRPGSISNPEADYGNETAALPEMWRIGLSTVFPNRMTVCMDFSLARWENAARTELEKKMYTDTYRFGAGIRTAPSRELNAPFYRKLPVSVGVKFGTQYYRSFPKVDVVHEKAVTAGVEIPFRENVAALITSFEFGLKGDKSRNGWEEKYVSIGLVLIGTIK